MLSLAEDACRWWGRRSRSRSEGGVWSTVLVGAGLVLAGTGCWTSSDGTRHRLILGVGVVSEHEQPGLAVHEFRGAGAFVGRDGAGVGLFSTHTTSLDPNVATNVVVQVDSRPFSLRVNSETVESQPSTEPYEDPN